MDGTLSTWYNGQPVITQTGTGDLSTWYNGQPFTFIGEGGGVTSKIKTAIGMARADIKSFNGIEIANIKSIIEIDNF
ncbi:MAG: hypothetical protein ABFC34_13785 [Methanobacterium sp.]